MYTPSLVEPAQPFTISVLPRDGVFLPQWGLWLDPHRPKSFAFISHAHFDHMASHKRTIASRETTVLMEKRLGTISGVEPLEFGESRDLAGEIPAKICLLPAGHVLGSAQIHLETADGESLLYTGDFKLREGVSSEPIKWLHADTLIMETTFGRPQYRFPPAEAVLAEVVAFCQEALEEGQVPVLLGYALGKAQEILAKLKGAGLEAMLHRSVVEMTQLYEEMGIEFPPYVPFSEKEVAGKVLICPPSANRSRMLRRIKNKRVAMLSGWALDKNAKYRYQVDACFPLSDHADYDDLLKYVELVAPRRVLTLHGFAADFARDLRELGIEAWSLTQSDQLELTLGTTRVHRAATSAVPAAGSETKPGKDSGGGWRRAASPAEAQALELGVDTFSRFVEVCREVAGTTSKLKKVEALASYLKALSTCEASAALARAAVYLTGHAGGAPLSTGWAIIYGALKSVSGQTEAEVRAVARAESDAGRTAYLLLEPLGKVSEALTLEQIHESFSRLRDARGPIAKQSVLEQTMRQLNAGEAEFYVRILTSDLRIGLKEGLLEEAIASAFGANLAEIKEANMLMGDVGEAAEMAAHGRLGEASPRLFHPISCMLAAAGTEAEQLWERAAKQQESESPTLWVQEKFDGIRAQLHVADGRAAVYSRDSRDISKEFTDVTAAAKDIAADLILDGEILAYEEGRFLRFFDLQKRLGRREPDLFMQAEVPIVYMAFDLLWANGESLLKQPLRERMAKLKQLELPAMFHPAEMKEVRSIAELDAAFEAARVNGHEGLVMKDPESLYTPGRRGQAWMKFKKHLETLDVVVVGVEQGHGKRSYVLSDYTFAVRDEATDELLVLGKAYTGLTDEEIEEMTEVFKSITVSQKGNFRTVLPQVVIEVAFDTIQPSKRHNSGLALRFPRIKAIRRDKDIRQIDTLQRARAMAAAEALAKTAS